MGRYSFFEFKRPDKRRLSKEENTLSTHLFTNTFKKIVNEKWKSVIAMLLSSISIVFVLGLWIDLGFPALQHLLL